MAYIVQPDVVHYACTCGLLKPISKLYFCRHCLRMRCGYCVCHEVDSHFCGKCAENIPSSEARLKKNRCSSCYDCPSCQHQLSIRIASAGGSKSLAASAAVSSPAISDAKPTPEAKSTRKVYYLSCTFCRWNTRDVGIPDQSVASGGWPERENVHANRLTLIQEKYKAVVLWDKQQRIDKEKKKHIQRGKYITMTDKTGLTAAMIRKRVGLPELPQAPPKHSIKDVPPAVAKEEVEGLPADIFTKELNLEEVSTLEQRHLQPEWQPENVNLLFPMHKHLSVKQSLRCRKCEHNVSKPEYNPNSIKFKIPLFAYHYIPEIRIVTVEPLRAGRVSELIIKICNPTQHQTTVTLLPILLDELSEVVKELDRIPEETDEENKPSLPSGPVSASSMHTPLARQSSITVEPRPIGNPMSAEIDVPGPDIPIVLPPKDDAAEYDDSAETHNFQDDPRFIIRRKTNKVALRMKVTPSANLNIGDKVLIGFTMQHIYFNTITNSESKEPQKVDNSVKIFLTLGKLVGSE